MHASSPIRLPDNRLGSTPATNCSALPNLQAFRNALCLDRCSYGYEPEERDNLRTLAKAKYEGIDLDAIPGLAAAALQALQPVEQKALVNRLTLLGMSMANGKDADMVKAWLHETARLLSDLPQGILFDAIDACVKEPGRVFVPSVGEIRDKASGPLQREERAATQLQRLARLIADGLPLPEYVPPPILQIVPEFRPEDRCSPEEARKILRENGFRSQYADAMVDKLSREPEAPKTRADYIAAGEVPPPIKRDEPNHSWDGMA